MILTVLEHMASVPLDRFAGWLAEPGVPGTDAPDGTAQDPPEVVVVRPWAGDPVPTLDEVGDGLIVLGGQQDAYDDVGSPWLPATRALLREAVDAGRPTLGICLGAQLLAVACGGRVQVAAPPGREVGVVEIRLRPEATDDPLLGALLAPWDDAPAAGPAGPAGAASGITPGPAAVRMPSMHADAVVELPPGAVWLASSVMYPYQAFRVGPAAWGLQFHPEVSPAVFAGWAALHDDVDAPDAVAQMAAHDADVSRAGRAIALAFTRASTDVSLRGVARWANRVTFMPDSRSQRGDGSPR